MLGNGACHLGNDVFIGAMSDVDDALFTLLGPECEELPLQRALQWSLTDRKDGRHSVFASPDGRYVLGLALGTTQHYLVNTDGGEVTIFETEVAARSAAWHPFHPDLVFVLLASGDVDVLTTIGPIQGSVLRRVALLPLLGLIHGLLGAATGKAQRSVFGAACPADKYSLVAAGKKSKESSLTPNRGGGGGGGAAPPMMLAGNASTTAALTTTANTTEDKNTAPKLSGPNRSQLCVLNAFNSTLVDAIAAICFLPPAPGQPLLLAAATSNGDVYAVRLGEAESPHSLVPEAAVPPRDAVIADLKALLVVSGQKDASSSSSRVRLLISTQRGSGGALTPLPLALSAFLIDAREGSVAVAVLGADGTLRTYYFKPDELFSFISLGLLGGGGGGVPIRTAADHETLLTGPIAGASVQQAGNCLLYRTAKDKTKAVDTLKNKKKEANAGNKKSSAATATEDADEGADADHDHDKDDDGDEVFLVALPMWLRKARVWAVRYDSAIHRGGSAVLPLSSVAGLQAAPAPIAIRVPMRFVPYSTALGTNDVLLFPRCMADGIEPMVVKVEHLLETAVMAMHRRGVRMLPSTALLEAANSNAAAAELTNRSNVPLFSGGGRVGADATTATTLAITDNKNSASGSGKLSLVPSASLAVAAPTAAANANATAASTPTAANTKAIQQYVEGVAKGCAAFYTHAKAGAGHKDVVSALASSEAALSALREKLLAAETANAAKAAAIERGLATVDARQSVVVAELQRMLDVANNKDIQQHGVGALVEVNKMLGELHARLNALEALHVADAARGERAVMAIREMKKSTEDIMF